MKIKEKTGIKFKNFTFTVPATWMPMIKKYASGEELTVSAYIRRVLKTNLKAKETVKKGDIIK